MVDTFLQDPELESLAHIARGTVLFVPAGTSLQLHSMGGVSKRDCRLLAYAATANENMFISPLEAARRMYRSVSDLSSLARKRLVEREELPILAHGSC